VRLNVTSDMSACSRTLNNLIASSSLSHYAFVASGALKIAVMFSPLSMMRPRALRDLCFMSTSDASSRTRFMYSSKPCERRKGEATQQRARTDNERISHCTAQRENASHACVCAATDDDDAFHPQRGVLEEHQLHASFLETRKTTADTRRERVSASELQSRRASALSLRSIHGGATDVLQETEDLILSQETNSRYHNEHPVGTARRSSARFHRAAAPVEGLPQFSQFGRALRVDGLLSSTLRCCSTDDRLCHDLLSLDGGGRCGRHGGRKVRRGGEQPKTCAREQRAGDSREA
jgi:hypothetical protein